MKWKCPLCDNKYDTEREMRKCIDKDGVLMTIIKPFVALDIIKNGFKDNKNQPPQAQDKADLKSLYDKHNKEKES